jgi:hypothetical protein
MNEKTLTTLLIIAVLLWLFTRKKPRGKENGSWKTGSCPSGQSQCVRQGQPLQTGGFKMHNLGCMTEQACMETPIPL